MTLRELRYLVALANRAHFGRAAEDCHVSQPTLSTQIRKLEEYLGLTLIERNAKSFAFTPIGEDVVEKARRIVTEVDALLSSARTWRRPLTGPLNLGVIPRGGRQCRAVAGGKAVERRVEKDQCTLEAGDGAAEI